MQFKSDPFPHQLEEWERHKDDIARGIFWSQGTGKSWLAINTAAWLWEKQEIDAVLIVAPNGVQQNWLTDEIPAHLPDGIPWEGHCYQSKRAKTKWHKKACDSLLKFSGLPVLAMSYEALVTPEGKKFARKFLEKRQVLYVADESHRAKSPSAQRARAVVASGKLAKYRRALTGTPMANSPFDYWMQVKFLDPEFWAKHDFCSLEAFKTYFGHWEERINGQTGQRFKHVVYYKNLDRLADIIKHISSRVTKEEVLDLPPRTFEKRYVELSAEQARLYKELRDEFCTFLLEGEEMVSANLVITRLLRLQQIVCGHLPLDDGETVYEIKDVPRLEILEDTVKNDCDGQVIIWSRFRKDIDRICDMLGKEAVRCDGKTELEERKRSMHALQAGDARFFVSNPAVGGTGFTLTAAKTMVYYSNSYDFVLRDQSLDRNYRISQDQPVHVIDLVAQGTVDVKLIDSIQKKQKMAATINRDEIISEWV